MASLTAFGALDDGRAVHGVRIGWPGGLQVEVLDYGAVVRRITAPTPRGPIETILGYDTLQAYVADNAYLGCVVGRCANRIAGATFQIDGQGFRVSANEGDNCLHGGTVGFNKRLWSFEDSEPGENRRCVLTCLSESGEEGFPGAVEVRASYEITASDTLTIRYEATCDQPTPVNLSQHLYFNLSGAEGGDILGHELEIAAEAITPVRPDLIPTGQLMPVAGTPFDLRTRRGLRGALAGAHPQLALAKGYDHNWSLKPSAAPALKLRCPQSGLTLSIDTDQPGMQVYSGQGLASPFPPHGAIVFEPQGFPDAVNQPSFPDVVLRPGRTYRHTSRYQFNASA